MDHHISAREQITLQDTVDATTEYSISQFGLDGWCSSPLQLDLYQLAQDALLTVISPSFTSREIWGW